MLATAVLGSSMAMLDGTVVNVALPTIGRDFWPAVSAMGGSRAHLIQSTGGSYEWSAPTELMRSPFELRRYGERRVVISRYAAWLMP